MVMDVKRSSGALAAEAGEGDGVVHAEQVGVVRDGGSKSPLAPSLTVV